MYILLRSSLPIWLANVEIQVHFATRITLTQTLPTAIKEKECKSLCEQYIPNDAWRNQFLTYHPRNCEFHKTVRNSSEQSSKYSIQTVCSYLTLGTRAGIGSTEQNHVNLLSDIFFKDVDSYFTIYWTNTRYLCWYLFECISCLFQIWSWNSTIFTFFKTLFYIFDLSSALACRVESINNIGRCFIHNFNSCTIHTEYTYANLPNNRGWLRRKTTLKRESTTLCFNHFARQSKKQNPQMMIWQWQSVISSHRFTSFYCVKPIP